MDGMGTIFSPTVRLSHDWPGGLWWLLSCDWVGVLNLFPWIRWKKPEMPGWLSEKKTYNFWNISGLKKVDNKMRHEFVACLQHQLFFFAEVEWSNLLKAQRWCPTARWFVHVPYRIKCIYIYIHIDAACLSLIGVPKRCTGNIENSLKTIKFGSYSKGATMKIPKWNCAFKLTSLKINSWKMLEDYFPLRWQVQIC